MSNTSKKIKRFDPDAGIIDGDFFESLSGAPISKTDQDRLDMIDEISKYDDEVMKKPFNV